MPEPGLLTPDWPAPPRVRALQTLRGGGCSPAPWDSFNLGDHVGDDPARVAANRAALRRRLPAGPVWLRQVHGTVAVDAAICPENAEADAAFAHRTGVACAVMTADCLPVLFCDRAGTVVAAAHAGWRGLQGGVLEATVAAMDKLGADRARIAAALGPLIRQQNYEVSQSFVDEFLRSDEGHARFFKPAARAGHAMFDLPGFVAERIRDAGIGRFEDLGLCTYADEARFFSYRRSVHRSEPDYGRHINAIVLKD